MNGDILLYNGKESRDESSIINDLKTRNYDKNLKTEDNEDSNDITEGYEYLLRLQIRSFTTKKLNEIKHEIDTMNNKIHTLTNTTETQLWLSDIDEFEIAYIQWIKEIDKEKPKKTKKSL